MGSVKIGRVGAVSGYADRCYASQFEFRDKPAVDITRRSGDDRNVGTIGRRVRGKLLWPIPFELPVTTATDLIREIREDRRRWIKIPAQALSLSARILERVSLLYPACEKGCFSAGVLAPYCKTIVAWWTSLLPSLLPVGRSSWESKAARLSRRRAEGASNLYAFRRHRRRDLRASSVRLSKQSTPQDCFLVMPGMVDAHVPFYGSGRSVPRGLLPGIAAAVRAGVTTVVEHTHAKPVITAGDLEEKIGYLADRSRVDYALGAHAWPDRLDAVDGVWHAGAAFIKVFTCTTHGVPGFSPPLLDRLFETTTMSDALCLVHCEEELLIRSAEHALRKAHRTDNGIIPAWRNREAELTAVSTVSISRPRARRQSHCGAREFIPAALDAAGGLTIESCPQYLALLEHEVLDHGALRKFTPPARARSEAELVAMWAALADGRIDYISSDHAPSTRTQKLGGSIWDVHFGLPGIDTTFSVLLDGAHRGLISYERVVEAYSERPARL